jgi:MATE family multidrug resistance protein
MTLTQFLVGFTDVLAAGAISPQVQAVFGILMQYYFFFLLFCIALVNGGIAAISQSLGAALPGRASRYIGLLLKLAGAACLATLVLGHLFRLKLLLLLQPPQEILPLALDLWGLILALLPAGYLSIALAGVLRAGKDVRTPLFSGILVCILNLLGDLGLGLGYLGLPRLGGQGLLLASILAVACGGLFNLAILLRRGTLSRRSLAPSRWDIRALPYMLKVALPSAGSQILWQAGYLVLFRIVATLPAGQVASVAGLTAGFRAEAVLFLPSMALGATGAILVGHCLGAGNPAEARRVGLRLALGGIFSMGLAALLLLPWVPDICILLSPDPEVQAVAAAYLKFNIAAAPFTATSTIMSGIFSGAGATLYSLAAFAPGIWLVRLPLAWYLGHYIWRDASGVFLAMLISQAIQATIAFFLFLRRDWAGFASTAGRWRKRIS